MYSTHKKLCRKQENVMIKKINLLIICCISLSLYSSENKKRNPQTLDDLKKEVNSIRENYYQHKPSLVNGIITRGNRINHEPINKPSTIQTTNQT